MPDEPNGSGSQAVNDSGGLVIPLDDVAPVDVSESPNSQPTTNVQGSQPPQAEQTQSDPQRSQYIPRDRFDQVNSQLQASNARALEAEQQLNAIQQQLLFNQQAPQQQWIPPTGQVPVQQQAPQQNNFDLAQYAQNMSDEESEEWQQKIIDKGPRGMAEFFMHMLQPLAQQVYSDMNSTVAPFQQQYVQNSIEAYESAEPNFNQMKTRFDAAVRQVAQYRPNLQLTPQVLAMVEQGVKIDMQRNGLLPLEDATIPYSESPGTGTPTQLQPPAQQLSNMELRVASGMGLTPKQYLENKRAIAQARNNG